MKAIVVTLLVFLACWPSVVLSTEAADSRIELFFQWKLSLDANGKISSLAPINPTRISTARSQLEPLIRKWHFTPGKINGQPSATKTTLTIQALFLRADGSTYAGRILSAHTGSTYKRVVAPQYPASARHAHEYGTVWFLIRHDGSGRIVSVSHVTRPGEAEVADSLVKAAESAVAKWTFEPETVGGEGVPGSVIAPVCFAFNSERAACDSVAAARASADDGTQVVGDTTVVGLDMTGADRTD